MGSGDGGMNPVVMIIINLGKNTGRARASNQRPPVLKPCTQPAEVWGSGDFWVSDKLLYCVMKPKFSYNACT